MVSLLYMILAFLPVLFYIFLIWATTPWRSINLRSSFTYLVTGFISVGIILTYFRLFPNCQDMLFPNDIPLSIFLLYFIQVALVEELCKFSAFIIAESIREKEKIYDSPIGIMIYCGISALGFAFIENVNYAQMYGGQVLITRSFLSMLVHFICGLIMGYWISSSSIPTKVENRSLFEIVLQARPKLKKIIYYCMGIISATVYHGFFDYSLSTGGENVYPMAYVILFGGMMFAYLGARKIIEKTKF